MQSGIDGKRIAALVGDGFEEAELAEPRRVLEEAGAIVTIVGIDDKAQSPHPQQTGPRRRPARQSRGSRGGLHGGRFRRAARAGRHFARPDSRDREVQRFVKEFDTAKKPMFSIGHGAHVLISAQVARGRTMTGSPSISDDIRNAGGLFRDQPTVQDGHWITTRGIGDMILFNRAMLEKLSTVASAPV